MCGKNSIFVAGLFLGYSDNKLSITRVWMKDAHKQHKQEGIGTILLTFIAMNKAYLKYTLCIFVISLLLHSCNSAPNYDHANKNDTTFAPTAVINTSRGKELFQQHCIACHGISGNHRNNNAADLTLSKIDSVTIVRTIINGKNPMPMFGHVMPDSDLAQLELYVKTLRK